MFLENTSKKGESDIHIWFYRLAQGFRMISLGATSFKTKYLPSPPFKKSVDFK